MHVNMWHFNIFTPSLRQTLHHTKQQQRSSKNLGSQVMEQRYSCWSIYLFCLFLNTTINCVYDWFKHIMPKHDPGRFHDLRNKDQLLDYDHVLVGCK